jgi:acylphosphatase
VRSGDGRGGGGGGSARQAERLEARGGESGGGASGGGGGGMSGGGGERSGGGRKDLEPEPEHRAVRWTVRGRVQGVGFRYATLRVARQVGVVGRVRNLVDGNVEIEAAGTPEQVRQLEAWLRQGGPPGARVVELREEPPGGGGGAWERFEIDR